MLAKPSFIADIFSWSFPDPSTFTGDHDDKLAGVIDVRDAIRERIEAWVKSLPASPTDRPEQAQPRD